jgi:hypothetical protein
MNTLYKLLILVIITFINISCKENKKFIYYSFNETTISRLDRDNKVFLYYGKVTNINNLPISYIEATYRGYDGFIDAYLLFEKDKTVKIIPISDEFIEINKNNNLFLKNGDNIEWLYKIKGNYNNVYRISNTIQHEIKLNKKNNSKVITSLTR